MGNAVNFAKSAKATTKSAACAIQGTLNFLIATVHQPANVAHAPHFARVVTRFTRAQCAWLDMELQLIKTVAKVDNVRLVARIVQGVKIMQKSARDVETVMAWLLMKMGSLSAGVKSALKTARVVIGIQKCALRVMKVLALSLVTMDSQLASVNHVVITATIVVKISLCAKVAMNIMVHLSLMELILEDAKNALIIAFIVMTIRRFALNAMILMDSF